MKIRLLEALENISEKLFWFCPILSHTGTKIYIYIEKRILVPILDTFLILSHFVTYWHQDILYCIEKRILVPILDTFQIRPPRALGGLKAMIGIKKIWEKIKKHMNEDNSDWYISDYLLYFDASMRHFSDFVPFHHILAPRYALLYRKTENGASMWLFLIFLWVGLISKPSKPSNI